MTPESGTTRATGLVALNRSLFFVSWPFFILYLLLPVYGRDVGASVVEIGLFFSAFSLMTVLMRPLIGWALDRFGRRPFLIAGLAGYAATWVSFAFTEQASSIVLTRALQGISSSFVWLPAYAVVADLSDESARGRAFGAIAQASSQGSLLGTFVGFGLLTAGLSLSVLNLEMGGWEVLFLVYGFASLVAALIALVRLPETRRPIAPVPNGASTGTGTITWSRAWLLLLLVTLVTGASWAMVSPVLIVFLQDSLDLGIETLSWAFLPSGLVWALLPTHLGRLADRFGRKPMMILGLVMASISSILIPALSSVIAFALVWALQALCYAAGDPAEQALVADLTGGDQRGRAYGFYAMAGNLGATIGPVGGAWLYQCISPQAPFVTNGILLALCAGALALWLRMPARSLTGGTST
ncbi:MAG TPA: MFS transporter [Anaerolineae bacterium]|nr:MFS transporter [Anaerolineae bacterium]